MSYSAEKSVKLEKHAEGPKDTNGSGKADGTRDDHDKPKPPPTEDDDSKKIETDRLLRTGTEIAAMAMLAALLIGAGVTAVLVIRRRRRS
ncbi:hypothetical protein F7P83_01260 [Brevibacterium luteolum]|nr:hypothetical protein [Brevibacterium luteolum]